MKNNILIKLIVLFTFNGINAEEDWERSGQVISYNRVTTLEEVRIALEEIAIVAEVVKILAHEVSKIAIVVYSELENITTEATIALFMILKTMNNIIKAAFVVQILAELSYASIAMIEILKPIIEIIMNNLLLSITGAVFAVSSFSTINAYNPTCGPLEQTAACNISAAVVAASSIGLGLLLYNKCNAV